MSILSMMLVGLVALIHIYIMCLEMFMWTTRGPKVFRGFPKDLFEPTKELAANQGLYNGFLAAGLIWSLLIENLHWQQNVALCFLIFVAIAGVYGALTAEKKIFFVQALPAILGIVSILVLQ